MKKRILSIVLAVLMLLSVMPVTAMAADRTTVNTAQNGIEATKTAKWVDKKEGIAEITITVKGEPPEVSTPEVDAVLVIDLSGSMNDNNKLNDAKAAAKKFVDKFFGTSAPASYKKSVRIAVVGYNGYAKAYADLTEAKDADALYTLFGSGYGSLSAGGGTNIQDGIYRAQQILKNGRAGAKKVMVVLSDGEPTYSFDANVAHTFGQNEETYGVKKNNFLYVVSEIDHTDRVGSGSAYATGAYHYYYYCKDDKNVQQYYYVQNHGVGTVSEAYWAKKDGTTIYSIGFGISQYESGGQRETDVYKVAQSLASDDKKFKLAKDGGELGNVFDGIANEVAKYTAYNPTVIDTMGKNFEVVSNSLPTDKKVTLKSDGSLEWDITDGELDTTEHKLTFQVKYDKTKLTDDEMLLTNGEAKLIYSKTEGGEQNQEQPITSGQVPNLAKKVTYVDTDGTKYTDDAHKETLYWKGTTVERAGAPANKEGYTFAGWTTSNTTVDANNKFTIADTDITFTATWTEKLYTLDLAKVWLADEGVTPNYNDFPTMVSGQKKKANEKVTLPTCTSVVDETNDGVWNFTGWVESRSTPNEKQLGNITEYTMPAKNVELSAVWTFQKTERYGVKVTKTATRTRTLADGTTDTVALATTGDKVRVGDVIHYTVTIKNTGNVKFPAGSHAGDTFAAATGSLIDDATQKEIPSGSQPASIAIALTEPNVTVTKTYTYTVLEADTRITNTANASIPNGTMEPERDSDAVVVTVEKPHSVTYEFESGLPTEVQNLLPTQDTNKYYKGDSVTVRAPKENSKQIGSTTYTFDGWHVDGVKVTGSTYTMDETDVTFVGKWTKEEQPPKTATLRFEFKSGTEGKDLPAGMPTAPSDVTEEVGKEVQLTNYTETVNDEGNKGKWTFGGWFEGESLTQAVAGDSYQIPEGGKTLYGKWTFTKDEPADTTLTIAYYLMHADGTYPSEATDSATTDGKVGEDFTAEPMKTAYDDKGYKFDDSADNRIRDDLVLDPNGNVFKLYYKAVPGLTVTKTIKDVTRDGERLDPTNQEVEVKEGDVIEYEITVKNSGKLNLTDVVLTDEFTGAEGDLNIISGDDYTVDGYEITLKNDLNVGDSVTIKATYEVQLGDSGYEISNKAIGAAKDALGGNVTGESRLVRITPDALKAFRIFGSVYKYVKSEKGTFNKDGETVPFEFKVTSDKKGEEILDTFTIDVEETVKAGETSEGDWGGFDFNLSEEEFENLDKKEFNGKEYPVVYLWELKGDLKNMSYSTKRITLYLDRPNISYYSAREPMVEYLGTRMAYADPDKGADADIINIYGKQSSSGGTVKVGPQLNRDDHVAYIMGYPDGTVQPKGEITRAEACTIFFRLLTDSSRDYYFSKTNDYTDVNAGDWFNNAISTLSNAGIVTGYNDGTFRPNQPITRGEMAKIIANFANLNKGTKSFTDLSGHWSKTYVELAAGNGWIAGYPDGSFRPDQKITRAETVTMINRVLERVPAKELRLLSRSIMLTFPDNNPGDWYYIAIQEASNSHEYQRSVYETTGDEMWTKLIDNVDWTKLEK